MASDWYEEMEKAEQEYDAREYDLAQEYSRGYEQGKSDATKELPTALYYDGFNDGYPVGRADAIEEFVEMLTNDWGLDIILAQSNRAKLKSFIVSNAEQLKEQKC